MNDCIYAYFARERGEIDFHEYHQILKNHGVLEGDVDREIDVQWYSDAHKDLYGMRPNLAALRAFRSLDATERQSECAWISRAAYEEQS